LPTALCATLAACAGTAPGGRPQFTAPPAISSVYSTFDLDVRLAATPSCSGVRCQADKSFDLRVARLGARLARSAYDADPALRQRVPAFRFVVVDKGEPGSGSDSQGNIVLFRGINGSAPDDKALAFMIAREMGHVIARHHDEKSATGILLSVIIQLFMPLTSLTGGIAQLTGSTASVVGSEIVNSRSGAAQTREADIIGYELVKRQGWSGRQVTTALSGYARHLGNNAWSLALKQSLEELERSREEKAIAAKA
jgi:predicted Zn-dependent protease